MGPQARPGSRIEVKNLTVRNEGSEMEQIDSGSEVATMRGYVMKVKERMVVESPENSGELVVDK